MRPRVDLNADMGESYGRWTLGDDAALMPSLTSANIACGFHGGDPHVMRRTVAVALEHGVGIGAHVGFPDLIGFGRRRLAASPEEVRDDVVYQAGALRRWRPTASWTRC
jgi:5-oxoprolinase (ATP-hydrolysing) subunit A